MSLPKEHRLYPCQLPDGSIDPECEAREVARWKADRKRRVGGGERRPAPPRKAPNKPARRTVAANKGGGERRPPSRDRWANGRGAAKWAEIHARAWTADLSTAVAQLKELAWIDRLAGSLGCGACGAHFRKIVKEIPPDLASNAGYFAVTVAWHNAVNRTLGKPELTVDQAAAIWPAPV